MDTKTKQALDLFLNNKIKESLRIFKTFKIGFTKDEQRTLGIAYECLAGKAEFYRSMKLNPEQIIKDAIDLIATKYDLKK